jgi:hypothetical protein
LTRRANHLQYSIIAQSVKRSELGTDVGAIGPQGFAGRRRDSECRDLRTDARRCWSPVNPIKPTDLTNNLFSIDRYYRTSIKT